MATHPLTNIKRISAVFFLAVIGLLTFAMSSPASAGDLEMQPEVADISAFTSTVAVLGDIDDFVLVPQPGPVPTVAIQIDCANDSYVQAYIDNITNSGFQVETQVNGVLIDSSPVLAGAHHFVPLNLDNHQIYEIRVSAITVGTIYHEDYTVDCAVGDPSYEVLTNCETGQAHVRMSNAGEGIVKFRIGYSGVLAGPYQEVAPGTHVDWLLAVDPGESVDFDVLDDWAILSAEHLDFDCPVEVAISTPEVVAPPAETEVASINVPAEIEDTVAPEAVPAQTEGASPTAQTVANETAAAAADVSVEVDGGNKARVAIIVLAMVVTGALVAGAVKKLRF